jgi:hypothetical protein
VSTHDTIAATRTVFAMARTSRATPSCDAIRVHPAARPIRRTSGRTSAGRGRQPACATPATTATATTTTKSGASPAASACPVRESSGTSDASCAATGPAAASHSVSTVLACATTIGAPAVAVTTSAASVAAGAISGETTTWP